MDTQSQLSADQLRSGLAQMLRTYSGAGLRRFNKSTGGELPADVRQQLANWSVARGAARIETSATAGDTASSTGFVDNRAKPIASSAPISRAAPIAAASNLTIDLPSVGGALGAWQSPALEPADRQFKLSELDLQVRACRKCEELVCYRRQTVFGEGHVQPRVCFYGEAPGADEDAQGRPFVGAAGKLLTDIIRAMRLTREEVYILNSLKCRPPQNRTPLPEEVGNCRPYALAQLEILQPEYIVLLGAVAVRSVLESTEPVGRLRGRFHHFHGAKVLVTYHPAYLLRNAEAKKLVWADVQLVMRGLAESGQL